ncbi:MAG TPA: hypothetical protein VMD27_01300 [Candidatus Aquilonibacter sp.]|nr:hypothetical protein [Candidatus Aquilonibacter sp.]
MKKFIPTLLVSLLFCSTAVARPVTPPPVLTFREISYNGKLSDDEARFTLDVDAEADTGSSAILLEGDVAVLPARLPDSLRIVREGDRYTLIAARSGHFKFQLGVVAKIQHAEPWNQVSFIGPAATIASITAQAAGVDTEVQLLNGTLLASVKTNGISLVTGFLGADPTVSLRWQAKVAEIAHKALLIADSAITAQVTPTVIKYTSKFHYDVVQGNAAELVLSLPAAQVLTHLDGEQIRDWHLATEGDYQTLTVEFIKPVENACDLTLYSEQAVDSAHTTTSLEPPQPLNVDRESGSLVISAEDTLVEIATPGGLRQVNAPDNALAAYQFDARPLMLALTLKPIVPEINVTDRVNSQLEETRLVISHGLTLDVEKAGIYSIELTPPAGFAVADVRGDGVEDWNVSSGKILVDFSARVLGSRQIDVQLEQALKNFPDKISIAPLHVEGAANETAQIGAASAPGIQLRTDALSGLREIPVNRLPDRSNEILAYTADQPDWNLSIASEKLAPRVVADVFNLVTIGDGIVGGSATIRYGLANQGVQEFKVSIPVNCKNVDFTGPDIRSKEQSNDVWTIGLQDKVWGGYTLVVTYDYQFDSKGATLPVGGIHTVGVERETGSIAITSAANLQLDAQSADGGLRRIDETELSAADRSFITRAVLLAYQYTGNRYDLTVNVKHFAEEPVLEAVADRTQITSVLTDAGEMLSQASFMVKNNEKQFQRFQLPSNAVLWSCYVNGQPAKPERDGGDVLVPLPRDTDRDQAFAVDIVYAQTNGALAATFGKNLTLEAPRTDVPNTYAEWQLFVPPTFRLSNFGGSMNVAQGTTYGMLDAWEKFLAFYGEVLRASGGAILVMGLLGFLVIALVISAARRGWNGVITLFAVMVVLAVLGAMLLPALAAAKRKAQRINSVSDLKQIGLAARVFAGDNGDRLPMSFEEMKDEIVNDRVTYDVETGQRFTWLGGGMSLDKLKPDSVLAYSPIFNGHCEVLYADGSVAQLSAEEFAQLSQRGLVQTAAPTEIAALQSRAISQGQLQEESGAGQALPPTTLSIGGNGNFNAAMPVAMQPPGAISGIAAPTAAGIRSIRIDLPQTGQPFLFTKVLNVGNVPLSIQAHIMPLRAYETIQMMWQTAAFLIGLAVWWWHWRREQRNTFILTVALALMLVSVCSLLVEWRALHDALIVGFPIAALAIISLVIWKYWPRDAKTDPAVKLPSFEPPTTEPGIPPVVAAIVLLFVLGLTGAKADDSAMASIVSANYSGTINDRVAALDATLQFSAVQAGEIIPLFSNDVAVQQFTVKSGSAELVRDGDNLAVKLDGRGDATLEIKMLVKIAGDVTKRQLVFAIPPALSSQIAFTLDEAQADVDFPTAISFKRILDNDTTRVEAVIGAASQVELLWTPRVKRADEVAATIFCQNNSLVTFGGGVMNVRATLDYQITQGELRQARVQLPAGQKLLRVEGSGIRMWEVKPGSAAGSPAFPGQTLVVDLLKGVSPSWQLTIETEKVLGTSLTNEPVTVPQALDVKRETGLVALRGSEGLGLSVVSASGLQRVDAEEFTRAIADTTGDLFSVFQFSKPDFALNVSVETIQPEIEAVVRNNFRVNAEQVSLSATIDYTIKRGGIFALAVALPEGYRVESVSGDNIQQWTENDAGSRMLQVAFKNRTGGAYTLSLQLTRDLKELPKSLALAGVYPLGAAKLTGFIAVSAEPGVAVQTETFEGLTEIPAVSLPNYATFANAGDLLAYKFILPEPKNLPEWKLSVTTEAVAAWVRAEVVSTFMLADSLASGRALVRYDIANAPVKELRVRVPENFQNVEITGPNIRSREQTGDVWRVTLQNPTSGIYTLAITWDQPILDTNAMEIAGVSAVGVERETGLLAISAKAPLQIGEAGATDLQRVDTGDFPDWAGSPDPATALAYRYVRPGYKLALSVRRLNEAQVLETIVDDARFTSVVAADGQMMTEMSLSVRDNGRQFLEIALPGDASVWSAFVAGQPVRPSVRDGKILLPIETYAVDGGAVSVDLTYVGTNYFPRGQGQIGFVSPTFDAPLKNARWELYLPPDYDYKNFEGTMSRETAPTAELVTANFSSLDYSRMEQVNKSQAQADLNQDVTEARQQLLNGNVSAANTVFNRAKGKIAAGDGRIYNADVTQLQKDLRAAQASNLVQAQDAFSAKDGWVSSGEEANASVPQPNFEYDSAAAEQQSSKLQQAQEIVTAKVQPLRVNLPVRGLHFAFTQVLQTETDRPMTIQLFAANAKAVDWPLRILAGAGLFLVLWILVAVLSRVTLRVKNA